ncbi:hypothetical protein [Streptomyces sp. NPDC003943]
MRIQRRPQDRYRWIKGGLESVADGERRVCADCRTPIRSYQYRFHPPESELYERCVGFAWCPECRLYAGNMVDVPRRRVLVDVLAGLPAERREALRGKEPALIDYLDRHFRDNGDNEKG